MLTSGMSLEYFHWVTAHSIEIYWLRLVRDKLGGIKWEKFTVHYMVRLYVVMLRMSIKPRHRGGYEGYFKPTSYIRVGCGYNVNILDVEDGRIG